jgi:hypothetical protein
MTSASFRCKDARIPSVPKPRTVILKGSREPVGGQFTIAPDGILRLLWGSVFASQDPSLSWDTYEQPR